jgi:hypothetical protein
VVDQCTAVPGDAAHFWVDDALSKGRGNHHVEGVTAFLENFQTSFRCERFRTYNSSRQFIYLKIKSIFLIQNIFGISVNPLPTPFIIY